MSSITMSLRPKEEEKPCNDVAERIMAMLGSTAMQKMAPKLGLGDELHTLLVDADKGAIKLLGAGDLLEKLEDALYLADDLVDHLSFLHLEDQRSKRVCCTFSFSTSRLKKITRTIRKIQEELLERRAREFRSDLLSKEGLKDSGGGSVEPKDVVGRDKEKMSILKLLLEKAEKMAEDLLVVPIVGDRGLGKTHLLKLILNESVVQDHFESRVYWLKGFDSLKLDYQLRYFLLPQKISGKRYLIVVDDVCGKDELKLKFLRDLLRCGASGSRLVVTTHSEEVAESIIALLKTHRLDYLDEEKKRVFLLDCIDEDASLDLLRKVARFKERQEPENLNEIVKMCGGNPLAIRTRGSVFFLEHLGTEWQFFPKREREEIAREKEGALGMLKSKYRHLPMYLKPCFAYCALFPKNYEIDVQTLIKLWMSQGFIIVDSSSKCLEDVGYDYFMELLSKLLFEKVKKDEGGKIRKCKMHELMHDLARKLAGKECVALDLEEEEDITNKTRHVSFDFHLDSPWQISDFLFQVKTIRTIILPSQSHWQIEGRSGTSICDTIVSNFKYLRTLDLHNSGLKKVSDYIGQLKHLRYLDLSQNTDIKVLPNSICGLFHLQTLKLNYCGRLEELPGEIKKLVNLRHLEIDSCYSLTHMPCGIGELTDLQTLSEFVLRNDTSFVIKRSTNDQLDELKSLKNLKGELRIKNLRLGMDTMRAELNQKQHLRSLVLIWDTNSGVYNEKTTPKEGPKPNLNPEETTIKEELKPQSNLEELSLFAYSDVQFPSWLPLSENLVKFSLWKCTKFQSLPRLHHLPNLKVLALEDLTDLGHCNSERVNGQTFFPSLKELRLIDLPKLKSWGNEANNNPESATTFPCLSKLVVEDCPNLISMPFSPALQLLVLKNTIWSPFKKMTKKTTEKPSSSSSSPSTSHLSQLKTLRIFGASIDDLKENWGSLGSLQSLTFDHLPYIETLPEGLHYLTGLKELYIWRCNNLKDISSECVSSLKSLEKLSIKLCINLKLPIQTIGFLKLKSLEIEDCPRVEYVLKRRLSS